MSDQIDSLRTKLETFASAGGDAIGDRAAMEAFLELRLLLEAGTVRAAVQAGYLSTLMRFRRAAPPALLPSTLGDLGALTGASELVFDAFLAPRALSAWPAPEQKTA